MVQFKAGSFHMDNGFIRSIERKTESKWDESMILVNMNPVSAKAEEAALHAKMDIDSARQKAEASAGRSTIDHELVRLGYNRLQQ